MWAIFVLNALFYTGAFVAFIMGYGWIALVCLIAAIVLTLILNAIESGPRTRRHRGSRSAPDFFLFDFDD